MSSAGFVPSHGLREVRAGSPRGDQAEESDEGPGEREAADTYYAERSRGRDEKENGKAPTEELREEHPGEIANDCPHHRDRRPWRIEGGKFLSPIRSTSRRDEPQPTRPDVP